MKNSFEGIGVSKHGVGSRVFWTVSRTYLHEGYPASSYWNPAERRWCEGRNVPEDCQMSEAEARNIKTAVLIDEGVLKRVEQPSSAKSSIASSDLEFDASFLNGTPAYT
jgi:hypothetical protein